MTNNIIKRLLVPEVMAGVAIIIGCFYLMSLVSDMPRASALLPYIVLWSGITLSVAMILVEVKKSFENREREPFFVDKQRFAIGAILSCLYVPAVGFIGFYTSTLVFIPLVGWIFGYRNKRVMAIVTAAFMAGIYFIFSFVMGKELPAELLFN